MSVLHSLAAGGYELGAGRLVPSVAAVVGLASVVTGWLALRRPGRNLRVMVVAAQAAGLVSVVVGALHAANSKGGYGTGNGLAGAHAALALGIVGMVLGGLALLRARRRTGGVSRPERAAAPRR